MNNKQYRLRTEKIESVNKLISITMLSLIFLVIISLRTCIGDPNIIFILVDDLGYGDLKALNGNSTNKTPNIDKMIENGLLLSDYYSPASVCTPARGSILTGKYFRKLGLYPQVLHPYLSGGLSTKHQTYVDILKQHNYSTHAIGKWHLGITPGHRAIDHGFDTYFGLPMSHNECISNLKTTGSADLESIFGPCPIYENDKIIEQRFVNMSNLDERYLERTLEIMEKESKYYIHLCTHHVHMPQYPSNSFSSSLDALDFMLGKIVSNIDNNTILIFTSDNGASYFYGNLAGNNKPLRCAKGSTWEGGHRVPAIIYSEMNIIPKNTVSNIFMTGLDWFSTILSFANISEIDYFDGFNMKKSIMENKKSPRTEFYFHSIKVGYSINATGSVMAIRWNNFKYHRYLSGGNCLSIYPDKECRWDNILKRGDVLYDLSDDIGERRHISNHELKKYLDQQISNHILSFEDSPSEIDKGWNPYGFPCAINCDPYPYCCLK